MKKLALVLALIPAAAYADKDFIDGKGATFDCADDATVNINHGGGVYILKGACKEVNLNGADTKLTIEKVESINVNGASNKITLGEVGAIVVNGAKNTVTWKKSSAGAKPGVTVVGKNNKISKAK